MLDLGPDRAGDLLEIVTALRDDGNGIVMHTMKMRPLDELGAIGARGG
jgi:hypothetical protein